MLSYITLEKIYETFLCLIYCHIFSYITYFFHHKMDRCTCCIVFSLISNGSNYVEVCQMYIMLLAVEFNVLRTLQETRQSFARVAAAWLECKEIFSSPTKFCARNFIAWIIISGVEIPVSFFPMHNSFPYRQKFFSSKLFIRSDLLHRDLPEVLSNCNKNNREWLANNST